LISPWAALLFCALTSGIALAQEQPGPNDRMGFSVKKAPQNIVDALTDFERYRDKNQWSKAFTSLEIALNAEPGGLLLDKDGLFIPTELKVRAELLSLPAAGRQAYRLFNDPKAEQLLKDAVDGAIDNTGSGSQTSTDNVASLRKIVERYFITSAGDKAADRLGDALFEAGEFDEAERCWRMIVENYPDTGLPAALLQAKRAIALARAGRWGDFEAVRTLVHQRFAGQTVQIGGKDVDAAQYLDGLARGVPSTTEPAVAEAGPKPSTIIEGKTGGKPLVFPNTDTPAWQIPLMDQGISDHIRQQLAQIGWGGMVPMLTDVLPAAAADEKRLYVTWMGSCFAADLNTGKMLWRTDKFFDFSQNVQQMVMQGQASSLAIGSMQVAGDRLLVTKSAQPNPQNGQPEQTRLVCLAADTGKTIWTSQRQGNGSLSEWAFVGKPLVHGDAIYACATPQQQPAMTLLCIGLNDGALRWRAELGNGTTTPDFRGMQHVAAPVLLEHAGKLLLLTNNGALLRLDLSSHQIEWAFLYPAHAAGNQEGFNPFMRRGGNDSAAPSGAMLLSGSTLYFKESSDDVLYAMDLSAPALKWKRPIDASVVLTAGDDRKLFLVGADVDCINAESREMLWSNTLSSQGAGGEPLFISNRMYVFDSRGVRAVQIETGESAAVFRGVDRDAAGGNLWRTADKLITISSHAITAYPLNTGGTP
jgi:outer membrane protein assembly factor BamB